MDPAPVAGTGPYWAIPPAGNPSTNEPLDNPNVQQQCTENIDPPDYNAELARDRQKNDLKLKFRFEHIFKKYSADFTGIGDEIDLVTGKVIVNNGHLRYMREGADLGRKRRRISLSSNPINQTDDASEDADLAPEENEVYLICQAGGRVMY